MTADTVCLLVLLVLGLAPVAVVASRGEPTDRLVGLQLASVVAVLALELFAFVGPGRSYDLILPLVLAVLSAAGTLVFTRLLAEPPDDRQADG